MSHRNAPKPVDDQVKLKKLLDELTKREENKFCADCGCRGPRWASINLGVFICIACSGIHRSLGVHLTFVRSVNLDSWTSDQVAQMQKWGNGRAKEYYEANVPRDYRIPNEHSSVREKELWIREKYERKRFVAREDDPRSRKPRHDSEDDDESEDDSHRRRGGGHDQRRSGNSGSSNSRTNSRTDSSSSRTGSSSRRQEAAAPAPARQQQQAPVTQDILSFDAFNSPPSTPQAVTIQPPPQQQQQQQQQAAPKQDEWASFSGSSAQSSSSATGGFADAFATPAPANQHVNKMANIMASFGPSPQQQQAPQMNAFGVGPQGMGMAMGSGAMPPMGMGGHSMQMGMGMMGPGGMPMNPMQMQQQPNMMMMNPMMQQQQQPNPMFGGNPMMGGNMFPGGAPPMGFPGAQMGMQGNPMAGNGMMNTMGGFPQQHQQQQFQQPPQQFQQQQQQQQQQAQGGLNQPFVNLGGSGAKNPFF